MTLKELSAQLDRLNFLMRDPEPGLTTWQTALKTALDDLSTAWMTHRSGIPSRMTQRLMNKLNEPTPAPMTEPRPEPTPADTSVPIKTKKPRPTGTID